MPPERPRASDFDQYPREPRSPIDHYRHRDRSRTPSPSRHDQRHYHQTRRSPNYRNGGSQQRLTPEESLDRYHSNPNGQSNHQSYRRNDSRYNGYRQGGREDFFESRRLDRENRKIDFWPRSPKHFYEEGKKHKSRKEKKSKEHKHQSKSRAKKYRSESDDNESSSDRYHQSRKHTIHRYKRHRKEQSDFDSETDFDTQERKRKARSKSKSKSLDHSEAEGEKMISPISHPISPQLPKKETAPSVSVIEETRKSESDEEDSDMVEVGPMPYNPVTGKAMDPKEFGRALRPGEGSAMAAFIEAGERIPRRGEIGLTGCQIEKFENAGYVMSGSRHRRMNAVRIRKENQVISAEEKRGILKMQAEEKAKREGQIISSFRE
ncbi:hypothetical protein O181_102576, partial [Austropuccinia psidii MF-1]|nr:hypothetical protein [Austropuccinia psidii MF-1]